MTALSADATMRWSRAVVVAGAATSLGTVAHVQAGGLLPPLPALVVVAGILTVWAAAALARPVGRLALVVMVGGGQLVVHLFLTATAGHADDGTGVPPSGGLAHAAAHLHADLTGPHALMAVLHLGAGVVVALWLAAGETALWALVALLGTHAWHRVVLAWWLLRLRPQARPHLPRTDAADRAGSARLVLLDTEVTRRGPPRRTVTLLPVG